MKSYLIISTVCITVFLSGCVSRGTIQDAQILFDVPPTITATSSSISIPLVLGKGGRRYVEVQIDGHKALLLVDSGALTTIVSRSLADSSGVTQTKVPGDTLYGGGGGVESSIGVIEILTIGDCTVKRMPVFFHDFTDWNRREQISQGHKIDGILGSMFFEQAFAVIDYQNNVLILKSRVGN